MQQDSGIEKLKELVKEYGEINQEFGYKSTRIPGDMKALEKIDRLYAEIVKILNSLNGDSTHEN